ncbi:ABC transporter ATP-binding protein [Corynebacterium nasicanis]|uniref:ABC transporter ATP-binding protein n=1 Tax=Corynebacterium nasicanis TaxID=1448267 RepID=A0ABW1Q9L6_9CORY
MTPTFRISSARVSLGGRSILRDVSLEIPAGQITAIIGPNGCGKSTLLRSMARVLPLEEGSIIFDGADIADLGRRELSRRVALMAQRPLIPEGITVAELVSRGRYPHQGLWSQWSAADEAAVARALAVTGLESVAERRLTELSGGQQQRVWLGLVLAQETKVVLLDEPTTFLDIGHQYDLLGLVEKLRDDDGRTVVVVLHDLQQALRFADHLVVMNDGEVVSTGRPAETLDSRAVARLFGLDADIVRAGTRQDLVIVPRA